MTDDTSRVPKLRFPGFTGAWEQRKLSNYITITGGNAWKSSDYSIDGDYLVITIANVQGRRNINDRIGNRISVADPGKYLLKREDILVSLTGNVGRVSRMTDIPAVLNQRVGLVKPKTKKIDDEFLFQVLSNRRFESSMVASAQGAAQANISNNDVLSYELLVPQDVREQLTIAHFFRDFDNTIALHQRKLSHLRQLKKGLLQKMFPKSGEDRPEVRFPGFVDAWEQRKLGDLLKEFSIKSKIEDEHKVLSSTNSGMEFREGRVSGTSNLGYKIIKNGDLVLSPQNLWLGNININNIGKGLVSPSYKTFELINIDSSFINPQLRTQKMLEEYKNSSTQGASVVRRNLEIDSFYQIKIFVPAISEQEKIGSFFKQLDKTIALHQRKLSHLQQQKKALLQQMFV